MYWVRIFTYDFTNIHQRLKELVRTYFCPQIILLDWHNCSPLLGLCYKQPSIYFNMTDMIKSEASTFRKNKFLDLNQQSSIDLSIGPNLSRSGPTASWKYLPYCTLGGHNCRIPSSGVSQVMTKTTKI